MRSNVTITEWMNIVRENKEDLLDLIKNYHPVNRQLGRRKNEDWITAPNAELACTVIRKAIRDSYQGMPPDMMFEQAMGDNDWATINLILNDAWFGVPESRSAWNIRGFRTAVHLIEEPPDEE